MYTPSALEPKWQKYWQEHKTFKTVDGLPKPKYYVLDMFPYPSGDGLHVGHPEGYTATDIMARYKRMKGFNVLHPMGWDAFGQPAEQYAIKTGIHPAVTTERNINRFREQLQMLGFSYDWDREVATTDTKYVKWTQWIFKKLYEKDLAYQMRAPVNFCEHCRIVVANEEIVGGVHERCDKPVKRMLLRQWMFKITAYADRLLKGLDGLDWPEPIKEMQRNWIGGSEGAEVVFGVEGSDEKITVFTTRPDTLFGATYLVLSPEHALVEKITTAVQREAVRKYVEEASRKSDLERTDLAKTKTGVFSGAYAVNPVNGEKIPIWIADYVLITYGTGAIMAVPSHDTRDFEFAKTFDIPVRCILKPRLNSAEAGTWRDNVSTVGVLKDKPADWYKSPEAAKEIDLAVQKGLECWTGEGALVNSSSPVSTDINGLSVAEAKQKITTWLEGKGIGKFRIQYKLRDWLFSRQRYWGEPIPVVHLEDGSVELVDDEELPVLLPHIERYEPAGNGESPLAACEDWLNTRSSSGKPARRETNTMPQWAGSCWYYLRFIDPTNDNAAFDFEKQKYWLPVDLYVGGTEHAVLHLLYARFWHMVLFDLGLVSSPEPFQKLVNQGLILGENGEKMSKSRGNVVNPDDVVKEYGADAFRLYEMFMGPLEASKPWNTKGISGVERFLQRVWRLVLDDNDAVLPDVHSGQVDDEARQALHRTIKKVTLDTEAMRFNTGIAAMMSYVNDLYRKNMRASELVKPLVLMLAPYAPHIAEELWAKLGAKESIAYEPWPVWDDALAAEDTVEIPVQVNGKLRGKLQMAKTATNEELLVAAKANEDVARHLEGKPIRKEIVVPGKLVNFVV